MKPTISLGRWFGVPVGLHYSWFIIAALIATSLAAQFAATDPAWSLPTVWSLAVVTAVLFFVSLVLHELAHSAVARAGGVPVHGITLFALGGVSQIEKDAATPAKEFWMAAAGPAASVAIAIVCRVLAAAGGWIGPATGTSAFAAVLGWLAYINFALALFNLIPGFPLDGGRILRSAIWAGTHNVSRATRIAARVGQVVALLFIVGGLLTAFVSYNIAGLWIAFIGWFLLAGAQGSYAQSVLSTSLAHVRVADVMTTSCTTLNANITVQRFVDEELLRGDDHCFTVSRDHAVIGLIGADDVKRVDRDRWAQTTIAEVMRPLQSLHPVQPDTAAGDALALMGRDHVDQVPVVSGGHLEGVLTLSALSRLLRVRRQLRV